MDPIAQPARGHFDFNVALKTPTAEMKTSVVSARRFLFSAAATSAIAASAYTGFCFIASPIVVLTTVGISAVAASVLTITAIYKYVHFYRTFSARQDALKKLSQDFDPIEAQKHFDKKLITKTEFDAMVSDDLANWTPENFWQATQKYHGFVFENPALAQQKWELYFQSDAAIEPLTTILAFAEEFRFNVEPEQMNRFIRNFIKKQVIWFENNTNGFIGGVRYEELRLACPGPEALQMIIELSKDKQNHLQLESQLQLGFARLSVSGQRKYAADKPTIGVTDEFLAQRAYVEYLMLPMDQILGNNDNRADFFEKVVKFDWRHAFAEKSLKWLSEQKDLLEACFAYPEFFQTEILTLNTVLTNGQKLGDLIEMNLQVQEATQFFETRVARGLEINLLDRNSPALQRLAIVYLSSHTDLLWGDHLAIECLPVPLKQHLAQTKTAITEETSKAASAKSKLDQQLEFTLSKLSEEMQLTILKATFERTQREQETAEANFKAAEQAVLTSKNSVRDMRTRYAEVKRQLLSKRSELSDIALQIRTAKSDLKSVQDQINPKLQRLATLTTEIERLTPVPTPREIEIQNARRESEPLRLGALDRNGRIGEIKEALEFHDQHPGKAQGFHMAWNMLNGAGPEQLRQELTKLEADNVRLKELVAIIGDAPLVTPMSPELAQKKEEQRSLQDDLYNLNRQKKSLEANIKRLENDHRELNAIVHQLESDERTLPDRIRYAEPQVGLAETNLTKARTNFDQARARFIAAESTFGFTKMRYEHAAQPLRYAHKSRIDQTDRTLASSCQELRQSFLYRLQDA